ncbi:heme-binding protein [Chloroflexota bacterium]
MVHKPGVTPTVWKKGKLVYGSGLTLDTVKKMMEAGEKEAEKLGVPVVLAITDAGGNLLALHRMNGVMLASIQIATDKALTAVFGKLPTGEWGSLFQPGGLVPLFVHERWITFGGGYPIINDGVILGGIGVSGGTIEDIYVAKAALQAGNFNTNGADDSVT